MSWLHVYDETVKRGVPVGGSGSGSKSTRRPVVFEDEEEEPPGRVANKRVVKVVEEDDEEQEQEREKNIRANGKRLQEIVRRAEPNRDYLDDDMAKLFRNHDVKVPIRRGDATARIVPAAVQAAIAVLNDYEESDRALGSATMDALLRLRDFPSELVRIDPQVVLYHTVNTGTCLLYLKEVVPVSYYLLARTLGATFRVQLTAKAKLAPLKFDEVAVREFRGNSHSERYQSFDCERTVDARIEEALETQEVDADFLPQIKTYIYSLGPVSPAEACDVDWLQTKLDAFREIKMRNVQILTKRNSKRLRTGEIEEEEGE